MNQSPSQPLVLAEDVSVTPVREYPEQVRRLLNADDGDFAVTRANARETTRLIGPDGARLLELFRAPRTIVQAILAFSRDSGFDPEETLDRAHPLVAEFIAAGFIVPAQSPRRQRTETTFAPGSAIGPYSVTRCVQVLEDSEVYQARTDAGLVLALKLGRPGFERLLERHIAHEAAVLKTLNGVTCPRIVENGEIDGRPFIATTWCEGTEAVTAASEARSAGDRRELLALLIEVARAYANLHSRGVVHGDVHPRNVLVDRRGAVTIIDFGLAVRVDADPPIFQGGIGFFSDPMLAEACSKDADPPSPNPRNEQYAIAALLYYLATGHHYVDFSLQREVMLRQIVEEAPLPFTARGVTPWPQLEAIITRGLEKDPERRFPDMNALVGALEAIDQSLQQDGTPTCRKRSQSDFVRELISDLDMTSTPLQNNLSPAPVCSVNLGAAGIAYAFYRLASTLEEPAHLAVADVWIEKAVRDLGREDAFTNVAMDMTPATIGHVSPYHTAAGVYLVRALIAHAMDDRETARQATAAFLGESRQECLQRDLTLGRCGTVLGCTLLLEAFGRAAYPEAVDLAVLARDRLRALWDEVTDLGSAGGATEWANLGMAHGWSGLLYATLRWSQLGHDGRQATGFLEAARARLDELIASAGPVGRGSVIPWRDRPGPTDQWMPGWCNGSAGLVHLGCLAETVFGGGSYQDFAERAAWTAWEVEGDVVDLCCGMAGRAYSLLELYRSTEDPSWRYRAERLAEEAVRVAPARRDEEHPRHSLYKGELGLGVLIAALEQPAHASMPMFGREQLGL